MASTLQEKVRSAPQKPGVYFFLDKNRKILYIGKATNLRNRLQSYFRKNLELEATKRTMLKKVIGCRVQVTNSNIEALILEAHLIKKYRPPHNVLLRDDKNYFFVGFTRETFPRIFLTHQPLTPNPHTLTPFYIGPFTEGQAIKRTLKLLRHVFPYATHRGTPTHCLFYDLGLCPIPKKPPTDHKQLTTLKQEYKRNIRKIQEVLTGRHTGLIAKLSREMAAAAKKQDFERAATLRDQRAGLERIFAHRSVINSSWQMDDGVTYITKGLPKTLESILPKNWPWRIEGYDISNIQGTAATGSMVVFHGMVPNKNEYRKFKIKNVQGANDVAMIKEVLTRRFQHPEWQMPDVILIDGGKPQLNTTHAVLHRWRIVNRGGKPVILALAKREEEIYSPNNKRPCKLPNDHPFLLLLMYVRDESHRFARKYHHVLRRMGVTKQVRML